MRDLEVLRAQDAVRRWNRGGHRPGELLIVDPDGLPDTTRAWLVGAGIEPTVVADSKAATASLLRSRARAVVVCARAEVEDPTSLVATARATSGAHVLLALGPGDVDAVAPSIMAGAVPALSLPLATGALLDALAAHWVERPASDAIIDLGPLRLERAAGVALVAGQRLELTLMEFRLLWALAESDGVARRERLWRLWPRSLDPHESLTVAMSRLRRKLATTTDGAIEIVTLRGLGYRLDFRPTLVVA